MAATTGILGDGGLRPANIFAWRSGHGGLQTAARVLDRTEARPGRFDNLWFVYSKEMGELVSRPERTPLWGYPRMCCH